MTPVVIHKDDNHVSTIVGIQLSAYQDYDKYAVVVLTPIVENIYRNHAGEWEDPFQSCETVIGWNIEPERRTYEVNLCPMPRYNGKRMDAIFENVKRKANTIADLWSKREYTVMQRLMESCNV